MLRTRVLEVDTTLMIGTRHHLGRSRPAVSVARGLSVAGEHAGSWLLLAVAGALLEPRRRAAWVEAGAVVASAHASSVVLKRVVRRPRPDVVGAPALVRTPSALSFPSSHAASTAAAALVLSPMVGSKGPASVATASVVVSAMGLSRVLLGVHYPSDVLAGYAVGLLNALALPRLLREVSARGRVPRHRPRVPRPNRVRR